MLKTYPFSNPNIFFSKVRFFPQLLSSRTVLTKTFEKSAICKSWKEKSANRMRGMMGMQGIRVGIIGIRRIGAGMRGIRLEMLEIRVKMMGMGGDQARNDRNKGGNAGN